MLASPLSQAPAYRPPPPGGFRALPKQIPAWRSKAFVQLNTGAAGGGKSRLCAEKVHAFCSYYPGVTAIMLRKTRESTTNSIVAFMKATVMGKQLGQTVHHAVGSSAFHYNNGSLLLYGGMKDERQREAIRSIGATGGVDLVWMEEATQFDESDFNEISARMRGNAAGWRAILLSTNPDAPSHWIYKRLIQGGEANVFYSSFLDNYHNPEQYKDILNNLTGVQYQRLVNGLWVVAEGAVYKTFSPEIHVLAQCPARIMFKRVICGVDWGFTNPGVMQVWGEDFDGRICLLEEVYMTQKLVSGVNGEEGWWVTKAKELKARWGVEVFVCDPSAPAYIATLQMSDLPALEADNDIRSGVDSVNKRLLVQADGRPRIYFYQFALQEVDQSRVDAKQPTGCLDEIVGYAWPKDKPNQPTKEVPVKVNDHAMDTMRYASKYFDSGAGVGFA